MITDLIDQAEVRMKKAVEVLRKDLAGIRAGRANPSMLDKVVVDYYGVPTPVNQLANISVPEPRLLIIQPWDKTSIKAIEKAIFKSNLGINPSNDGNVIRLSIPQLTEERRGELVKVVKKQTEELKVAVRNIRRDENENLKKLEKDKVASEDDVKKAQEKVQKLTDKYIKELDDVLQNKENEIMEV